MSPWGAFEPRSFASEHAAINSSTLSRAESIAALGNISLLADKAREFPVYPIAYPDGELFYLSAMSGHLLLALDTNARWSRWLFGALHRGDFSAWARSRPIWYLMILTLLIGRTIGVGAGS